MTGSGTITAPVSVVIPAYNSRFIEETLASVYAQTVAPAQVIVVNDGSTDETEERLRSLANELPPSFIWRSKQNGGEASARNAGLRLATSTYTAFLDHDDLWHPEKLERQLAHFASDPELDLSFTAYSFFYRGYSESPGRNLTPQEVRHSNWDPSPVHVLEQLLDGRCPIGTLSSVTMRRDALLRILPFDEELFLGSDYEMYLKFALAGMKMDYLPDELTQYRWHGSNLSRDTGVLWEHLCQIFDRFLQDHSSELPERVQVRARWWRAHWHLQTAIDAIRHGDRARARRHILTAARIRPASLRPGWFRMLGIGSPPAGPWP